MKSVRVPRGKKKVLGLRKMDSCKAPFPWTQCGCILVRVNFEVHPFPMQGGDKQLLL